MDLNATTEIELDLFLDAVLRFHGYDLTNYSRDSIRRRVMALIKELKLASISMLIPRLANEKAFREYVINFLMVNVSSLFRDPTVFSKLVETVFPYLKSFPRISIWVAGCAEGLEAYSLAILLDEHGLLARTHIYATDINSQALRWASSGTLKSTLNDQDEARYIQSLGEKQLQHYFSVNKGVQTLSPRLLSSISFEQHNLIQQPAFISAQLVLCRNVLIYFDADLKEKALDSIWSSLDNTGYLMVSPSEYLSFQSSKRYTTIDTHTGLYKKAAPRKNKVTLSR